MWRAWREYLDAVLAWHERWSCGSVSHITLELRWILVVPLYIETCTLNVVTMDLKDLTRSDGETMGQEQDTDMIYSEILNQRSGFRILGPLARMNGTERWGGETTVG